MLYRRYLPMVLLLLPTLLSARPASGPASGPASVPATRPENVILGFAGSPAAANMPGFHKLILQWEENGQKQHLTFSLYLPAGYGQENRRWPMLTFLGGLGDRGVDPGISMAVGVPLALGRDVQLQKWMPMIVLTPQCPSYRTWASPGIAPMVLRLVHAVAENFAVDRERLYVTGFSDGGKGSWVMAVAEPGLFAAAASVVSREYQAVESAQRLAGSGTSFLVISGLDDPVSEPASAVMVENLCKNNVDVVYVPVPGGPHGIWQPFFSRREFYQWLLAHRRGEKPSRDRFTAEQFLELYASRDRVAMASMGMDYRLQKCLNRLEPYWFIDNCGITGNPGLFMKLQGRDKVLVTSAFSAEIPCRLQTTRHLPGDKAMELVLEVGHPPGGQWELVVRLNEVEKLKTLVNDQTAPSGWVELKLGLEDYAGGEVRVQLVQNRAGNASQAAYWSRIKLVEKAGR